jgi:hypothetical protein
MECLIVRTAPSEAGTTVDILAWYQGCDPAAIRALQRGGRPDMWPVTGALVAALRRVAAGPAPSRDLQEAFLCPQCLQSGVEGPGCCIPISRVLSRLQCTGVKGTIDCAGPSPHVLELGSFVWQLLPCDAVEVARGHPGRFALVVGVDEYIRPDVPSADTAAGLLPPLAHRVAAVFPRVLHKNSSQVPCLEQTCVEPGEHRPALPLWSMLYSA